MVSSDQLPEIRTDLFVDGEVRSADDALQVMNATGREPVEISLDGEPAGELEPGNALEIRFEESVSRLAQLPGSSFYQRIREKFGHLAV